LSIDISDEEPATVDRKRSVSVVDVLDLDDEPRSDRIENALIA
jgi:hypothetical protein